MTNLSQDAKRLSIYIGESDRWRGKQLYVAILETLKTEGLAGASVFRGVAGFGAHSRIHTAAILRLSEDLPLCIQVVDSPEKIERAIEIIAPMVKEGLITLDDVKVIRYTHRYLNPLPVERLVSEIMTREVVTITPDATIADAWQKMLDTLIKAMPVVDESGGVVGMLTDEDLLERAGVQERLSVAEKLDAQTLQAELGELRKTSRKVEDVMTRPAITVRAQDSLGVAARRMAKNAIKRLPVVDETGRLVGVLSRADILQLVTGKETGKMSPPPGAAKSLQDVMSPRFPVVRYNEGLAAIVDKIVECGCHRVLVVDFLGKAIGLISDSDVVARIQPEQRSGVLAALFRRAEVPESDVTAEKLMSPKVLTAGAETTLVEAAKIMMASGRKWLVVVDENERPLGLVDRHILLRSMIGQ